MHYQDLPTHHYNSSLYFNIDKHEEKYIHEQHKLSLIIKYTAVKLSKKIFSSAVKLIMDLMKRKEINKTNYRQTNCCQR